MWISDEDNSGGTEIQTDQCHLSLVERIAIWAAGIEAKTVFNFTLHRLAGHCDRAKIMKLVEGLDEDTSLAVRNKGAELARELLRAHQTEVHRLAECLMVKRKIDQDTARAL
jgi:hypothetical protein